MKKGLCISGLLVYSFVTAGLLLLSAGCSNISDYIKSTESDTGTIKGKVVFSNSSDSSGISITIEATSSAVAASVMRAAETNSLARAVTASATTGTDGTYTIPGVPAGTYTVYAWSTNASEGAVVTGVTVSANTSVTVDDMTLKECASIKGSITVGGGGGGLTGYIVYIAGTSYAAYTADDGSYEITDVPVGTGYSVYVQKDYTQLLAKDVAVTSVGITLKTVDFVSSALIKTSGNFTVSTDTKGILFSDVQVPVAGAVVTVTERKTGIQYVIKYSSQTTYTRIIFPFVTKGSTYTFNVTCKMNGIVYYSDDCRITATAGLGELALTTGTSLTAGYDSSTNILSVTDTDNNGPELPTMSGMTVLSAVSDFVVAYGENWSSNWSNYGTSGWICEIQPGSNELNLSSDDTFSGYFRTKRCVQAFLAGKKFFFDYEYRITVLGYETGYFRVVYLESDPFTYKTPTPYTVTVSWDMNGGSGTIAAQSVDYGYTVDEPVTVPTRSGYTFIGWNENSAATEPESFPVVVNPSSWDSTAQASVPLSTMTLYAVWEEN